MSDPLTLWPAIEILQARLSEAMLGTYGLDGRIVSRAPNRFSTTFPTEVVTCEMGSGKQQRLFCKHFRAGVGQSYGKFAIPFYEIDVYRHILAAAPLSLPRFLGAWTDPESEEGLLVLEYLDERHRLGHVRDRKKEIEDAASWIGEFHRYAASPAVQSEYGFLVRRDAEFYTERWVDLVESCGRVGGEQPWLGRVSDQLGSVLKIVEEVEPTVVHGDFYPDNIMVQAGGIFPVDWGTASISMGEMDLVALVDCWPKRVDMCINAYAEARGVAGDRRDLLRRFAVGQMLLNVYWLSYCGCQVATEKQEFAMNRRFEKLRNSAQQLGLL